MAKVQFDTNGMSWSGKLGGVVYRRLESGETVVQMAPEPKKRRKSTDKEEARNKRTRRVGWYCRRAAADPTLRPVYDTIRAWEKTILAAVINRDAFNPPVVEEIDTSAYGGLPGDVIAVAATDDTGVVRVDVALYDADGERIEKGEAEQDADGWWLYTAQQAVPEGFCMRVMARAVDRPDRTGFGEVEIEVKRLPPRRRRRRRRRIPYGGGHPALWRNGIGSAEAESPSPGDGRPHSTSIRQENISDLISNISHLISAGANGAAPWVSSGSIAPLDPAVLLRDARSRAGLSQKDLAKRAGTAQSAISRIERGEGNPTVETLLHLLAAAGFRVMAALEEDATA